MNKSVIIAQCVAIVTAVEGVKEEVKTSAILNINGNTIKQPLADNQPHQFEVGKSYEVSFSPATEEAASNPTPATPAETSDAPNVDGIPSDEVVEVDENLKEAA